MESLRDAAIAFSFLLNAPLIARWVFMLPAVFRAENEAKRLDHEAAVIYAQVEMARIELEREKMAIQQGVANAPVPSS